MQNGVGTGGDWRLGGQAGSLLRWEGAERRAWGADVEGGPQVRGRCGREVWCLRLRTPQNPCSGHPRGRGWARGVGLCGCTHVAGVSERGLGKAAPCLGWWPAVPSIGREHACWKSVCTPLFRPGPGSEQSLCCSRWSPYGPRSWLSLLSAQEACHSAMKTLSPGDQVGRLWS